MKIRCVIVDDEPPAVDELSHILSGLDEVELVAAAGSARQATQVISKHKPDLVFLDIQMPGQDGFSVLQAAKSLPKPPLFVFATAYEQYAVRAFEAHAVDYVLKPFAEERILESVQRAREIFSSRQGAALAGGDLNGLLASLKGLAGGLKKISVVSKGRILLLDIDQVVFFKAEDNKIFVKTHDGLLENQTATTLKELEEKLGSFQFFRTSRSHLVNLSHVKEVIPWFSGRYILRVSDEHSTEITVSRGRVKDMKKRIGL